MAPNTPITPVADLVRTAAATAETTADATVKGVAAAAVATIQLARNLIDSAEGLAELGIDVTADTLDGVLAKLSAYIKSAGA